MKNPSVMLADFFVFVETRLIASVPDCALRLYRIFDFAFVRLCGCRNSLQQKSATEKSRFCFIVVAP